MSGPVFLYDHNQVGHERRSGYDCYGTWAASLRAKDYPAGRARLGSAAAGRQPR